MTSWAVFDVDGTLLPKTSMEKMFMIHSLKNGNLPLMNVLYYTSRIVLKILHENFSEAFKNNKSYLKNLRENDVKDEARILVQDKITANLSKTGLDKVQHYRNQGYKILLMSGSPDFLTNELVHFIKCDHVIATTLEITKGKYTGTVLDLHPYGLRKTQILKRLQSSLSLDFQHSVVFANHHSDVDHMCLFGNPIAVNPTKQLRKIAIKQEWPIESWN